MSYISVILLFDGALSANVLFTESTSPNTDPSADAEAFFLKACREEFSEFENFTQEKIDSILDDGYFSSGKLAWYISKPQLGGI